MSSLQFVTFALLVAACSKQDSAGPARPITDPVPMTESSEPEANASVVAMLDAYEQVRATLASDDLAGSVAAARVIETSSAAAAGSATSASAPHYQEIGQHAKALATAADLKAARASFGEVSRHVVALLASDKSLTRGRHVFECPMVTGYRKWVQRSSEMANPYMGKKMLACGGETTWD
jgi:Cu(I)/Ag(I) efflux system membrane fusion protein